MSLRAPLRWLAGSAAMAALAVSAQTTASTAAPAPYRSALEGYQAFGDDKPIPWKEANDTVGKIGGWRAYAREAQQPQAPDGKGTAAPVAPSAGNATNPHAGHGKP